MCLWRSCLRENDRGHIGHANGRTAAAAVVVVMAPDAIEGEEMEDGDGGKSSSIERRRDGLMWVELLIDVDDDGDPGTLDNGGDRVFVDGSDLKTTVESAGAS